jgi:two-component system sensor histidine kinase/response regulator
VDFFMKLFDTSDFPARWNCGAWTSGHGWLHILSDLGVWLAYLAIPCVLGFFLLRRKDIPFRGIFWLFGAFILACGTTHLMEAIIFWWPAYRLAGVIKLFTAIVSWGTVIALVPIVPKALSMRSSEEFEREIAERKRVEEALRLAKARVELAVHGSNIGIWEIDMPDGNLQHGRLDFMNVFEQLGYDRTELPDDFASRMTLVHPDDQKRVEGALQAYLSGQIKELDFEQRTRHKNGSYRWMLVRGVAMRDPDGRPIRMIGSSIDITDHKRAEEALRESETRFRGTFENAAVGIAHKDAERRLLRVNEKFCEIVGYNRDELLAKTFQEFTYPEDLTLELEQFTSLMRGEMTSFSLEKRYVRKDGSLVWGDTSVSLHRDASGAPAYAIAILQDITQRKQLEGKLRQATEFAEAANRAKDEFLANVSHEIRTPMNAVLGMTELVLDTTLTDDQRQCLETANSAADNLLGLINDLLDFSKIEAGMLELDPIDFSLGTVLADTLRALAMRAQTKGLELICHLQPGAPDALIGDAGRLRQVLFNLLGNAIKFTDQGEVVLQVDVVGDPNPEGEVYMHFSVRDTGIGIPRDKQAKIFRAFEQEDGSTTRRYGGTGLGLTIANRLVNLMGGTIVVESEPGLGSTFSFTAKFGQQAHPVGPSITRPPAVFYNVPVLIVDDNATNRRILEEWLRGWQMEPTAVADGAAAMDALWHGLALGRPYSLVLLDACMAGTDGLALAAMVRERTELAGTRLILLSSADRPSDRIRSRELRIDAHLLKPVPPDELLETIYRVMSRTNDEAAPIQRKTAEPALAAGPLRILVAEDNEFNIRHLERLLNRRGHRLRLATNGREALTILGIDIPPTDVGEQKSEVGGAPSAASRSRNSDFSPLTNQYDVLLLDLHMPILDGFQVIRAIRERERMVGGHLPVIALTARSRKEDRERCLAVGMDEYLSKPVRTAELFATIDRIVSAYEGFRPASSEIEAETSLLAASTLLGVCDNDAEGLRDLCQDFKTYMPDRLAAVENALREQDAPRLREDAHKLCGLLSAFSSVAGNVASDLEDRASQGELQEAKLLATRLKTMVEALSREVDGLSLASLQRQAERAAHLVE